MVHASSHSRALGLDTAHLNGRSNTKMEPTRLTVRAIMALRRAAHFERWPDEPGLATLGKSADEVLEQTSEV